MICTCILLYYWVPKHSIRNETPQSKSKIDNLALELEGIESLWKSLLKGLSNIEKLVLLFTIFKSPKRLCPHKNKLTSVKNKTYNGDTLKIFENNKTIRTFIALYSKVSKTLHPK